MICNRLTDDAMGSIEELRGKITDTDDKLRDFAGYAEERLTTGYNSGDTTGMEDRINKRTAESIEQLGDILK